MPLPEFLKKNAIWFGALTAMMLLNACSTANSMMGGNSRKEAVAEISWDFAKDAVLIELDADQRLNQYNGEAHTLLLGIYQMADPAPFYKLIADPAALGKALESGKAGEGFVQSARYVVTPGKRAVLSFDRAQQAKFVGIVAGYYRLDPTHTARLFEVPLSVVSDGMLAKTYSAAPAPLAIRLTLGPETLLNAQRLNHDPAEKRPREAVPLDGGGKEIKLTADELKNAAETNNAIRKLQD